MSERPPAVAGQFYPGSGHALREMLEELFRLAETDRIADNNTVAGVIAPHAGYVFSGRQAAKAYQYLAGHNYSLACIISPSHRDYFPFTSVFPGSGYRTPLGVCTVHEEARKNALCCEGVSASLAGHQAEHALEVQLPFLQYILPDLPILPLVMGEQSEPVIRQAEHCVRRLRDIYEDRILFIASSDLSHFHTAGEAAEMDMGLIGMLDDYDDAAIAKQLRTGGVEACGGGPILALMRGLGKEMYNIRTLGYSHSGEVLRDDDRVVGYTSALILKKGTQAKT
ncbi:MAG: AmmeMemoRadiSam system protein B [FCB group bacterium]|nr:AmmeMemoRadiSam system protein B [FCB group bacterium]